MTDPYRDPPADLPHCNDIELFRALRDHLRLKISVEELHDANVTVSLVFKDHKGREFLIDEATCSIRIPQTAAAVW